MDAAGSHQLKHGKLRDCETLAARFDDERGNDGECQWNLNGEGRAHFRDRLQLHGAADLLHIGAHHVHANAATGNAGNARCRRKPRRKDQIADFRIGFCRKLAFAQQAVLKRERTDPFDIETAAVIGNLDDNVTALMAGRQPNLADTRLAGRDPFGRDFRYHGPHSCERDA